MKKCFNLQIYFYFLRVISISVGQYFWKKVYYYSFYFHNWINHDLVSLVSDCPSQHLIVDYYKYQAQTTVNDGLICSMKTMFIIEAAKRN